MKKIFVSLLVMLSLFNSVVSANSAPEGLHYSNGWFDQNPGKFTAPAKLVDNNLNTWMEGSFSVEFVEDVEVKLVAFYAACYNSNGSYLISFINTDGDVVKTFNCKEMDPKPSSLNSAAYALLTVDDLIKRIDFYQQGNIPGIYEFEIFDQVATEKVKNLKVEDVTYQSILLTWELPNDAIATKIFLNDMYVTTTNKNSFKLDKLLSDTVYKIGVSAVYKNIESTTVEVTQKTEELSMPNVEISSETTINGASIRFDVAGNDVKKITIYDEEKTSKKFAQVYGSGKVNLGLTSLEADTTYNYYARYEMLNGEVTDYVPFTFKTAAPSKEVADLKATATAENVDLKWKLPVYTSFEHAVIYRKEKAAISLFSLFAADDFTPLFETNGTTFKDLTVAPDTSYTYKVTTVASTGDESEGKTVDVKTQKMSVSGGGTTVDENGNYVIRWEKPTTGKIKVLVGGVEYAIVPATDKKIVIPAEDMKFNFLGQPDVKLIPVDDQGKEGNPSTPGGGGGGSGGGGLGTIVGGGGTGILDVPNLLAAGVDLLTVVGPYLLLGLAFIVVPILISLIKKAWYRGRAKA